MPDGIETREETFNPAEAMAAPGGRDIPQMGNFATRPRKGSAPWNPAECPLMPVRFARAEIILPAGAQPGGVPVVSLEPQEGVLYPGVMVRWGCPYEWLLREGILNVRVMVNESMAYQLAERNANPRDPVLIPQCWKAGQAITVAVSWADATLTGATPIPFWAEMALGTEWPPVFDDDSRNRVPRRVSHAPFTVLPGAAFASISAGVIRPTAGRLYMQVTPLVVATSRPQFSFATVRGGGAGNIAGSLQVIAPLVPFTEIGQDDLRDVFLGDPLAAVTAPTVVYIHREVW
jgi:hypothetical protein